MKDIKSLYLTAKTSGNSKDVTAYTEAVAELLESNPNGYISNLEYIISSSIGLNTLNPFIEKYGLSLACYDNVMGYLDECVHKCDLTGKDSSEYKAAIEKLESFHEKYENCFTMFEAFRDDLPDNYVSTYYGVNSGGIQNRRLAAGMLNKFGEAAVPDILITASSMSESTVINVLNYLEGSSAFGSPTFYQWVMESAKDVVDIQNECMRRLKDKSLEGIVEVAQNRNQKVYREAVLMGEDSVLIEYSDDEFKALEDLISFKEYQITCMENESRMMTVQNEIYSLYEDYFDVVDEDVADSVIPMQPTARGGNVAPIEEALWAANTHNKKTGNIPSYLANNHDLGYGEDETGGKSSDDEPDEEELKRPSANDVDNDELIDSLTNNSKSGTSDNEDKDDEDDLPSHKGAVNNYYYYTYNNSLNKNSHSFNKDNSRRDNHSVTNHDDHSVHTRRSVDDHSFGKTIKDDHSTHNTSTNRKTSYDDHSMDKIGESGYNPWDINLPLSKPIMESGSSSKGKKEMDSLKKKLGRNPTKNEMKSPPKSISVTVGTKDKSISMSFEVTPGSAYGDDGWTRIKSFDEFPMAVYYLNEIIDKSSSGVIDGISDMNISSSLHEYIKETLKGIGKKSTGDLLDDIKKYNVKSKKAFLKRDGNIGFMFESDVDPEHGIGLNVKFPEKKVTYGQDDHAFESANILNPYLEEVGDADDDKPKSDHPIKDVLTDIDRNAVKVQQKVKKGIQNTVNVGKAAVKPIKRTSQWLTNMVANWKDHRETRIKEQMADPHARSGLFKAIRVAIKTGAYAKAGLLLNPVFLTLSLYNKIRGRKRNFRLRNEMIGELKAELEIIKVKIDDAARNQDDGAKYKLMRLQNELQKKLLRVGGPKGWKKII